MTATEAASANIREGRKEEGGNRGFFWRWWRSVAWIRSCGGGKGRGIWMRVVASNPRDARMHVVIETDS